MSDKVCMSKSGVKVLPLGALSHFRLRFMREQHLRLIQTTSPSHINTWVLKVLKILVAGRVVQAFGQPTQAAVEPSGRGLFSKCFLIRDIFVKF